MAERGRPPIFATPEDFAQAFEAAKAEIEAKEEPITLTGMIFRMGMFSRATLKEYEAKPEFSEQVKRMRLFVEMQYERRLHDNCGAGPIFALKNMGWSDKQEHEHGGRDGAPIAFTVVSDIDRAPND